MSTPTPIWPVPKYFEGRMRVDAWELEIMLAAVVGRSPPPKPAHVELLTPKQVAVRVGVSEDQVRKRLRQRRRLQEAAADADADQQAA